MKHSLCSYLKNGHLDHFWEAPVGQFWRTPKSMARVEKTLRSARCARLGVSRCFRPACWTRRSKRTNGTRTANNGSAVSLLAVNGDSIFNDRPAWATDFNRPSVIRTPYGVFDTNPVRGQAISPRNLGSGPGLFTVNLRLSRSFSFGERAGQAARAARRWRPGRRTRRTRLSWAWRRPQGTW